MDPKARWAGTGGEPASRPGDQALHMAPPMLIFSPFLLPGRRSSPAKLLVGEIRPLLDLVHLRWPRGLLPAHTQGGLGVGRPDVNEPMT